MTAGRFTHLLRDASVESRKALREAFQHAENRIRLQDAVPTSTHLSTRPTLRCADGTVHGKLEDGRRLAAGVPLLLAPLPSSCSI